MLVRQILVASLLAVTAIGAMSQEIDRSETLQARSLAWTAEHSGPATGRTRESVVAETRRMPRSSSALNPAWISRSIASTFDPSSSNSSSSSG